MSTMQNDNNKDLKYEIVADIAWIESEIGMIYYNKSSGFICLPAIVNITLTDLNFVISELTKVETLIKRINND